MPDPQAMAAQWFHQMSQLGSQLSSQLNTQMSGQFGDPAAWQAMLNMPQARSGQADPNPLAALLKDAGVGIDPATMETLRNDYLQKASALWQGFMSGHIPELKDRRFAAPEWRANPLSAFNAASYLLNAEFLLAMAEAVTVGPKERLKIGFAVQQMVDAMSPANFLATNPEAQQHLIETKGESLTRGLANMLSDMQKGRISLSDESAFEVGRNVATTPGQVVFQSELFQLIQYAPVTPTVHAVPLLMVPPCINKFYILDLQPENSVVKYAVEQGNTVFLVSWRNADKSVAGTTWDDYVQSGAIKALEVVADITGAEKINTFGFCVGGTILSSALALLAAQGKRPAASITLLTTLLDFEDPGVLNVFIDETQVALREQQMAKGGLMAGRDLATTFSALRPNDLVWNYVQSNYLKGKEPPPFDLLYWNSDSTNLPGPMFCWYLRNLYLENKLRQPGGVTIGGTPLDLGTINVPAFIYGSKEDHIVPWTSSYASMSLLNPGNPQANRFVLGASGHIAGVINPASKGKRSYWTNDGATDVATNDVGTSDVKAKGKGKSKAQTQAQTQGQAQEQVQGAQEWFGGATEHKGSWWPEWAGFLVQHGGEEVPAPQAFGNARYQPLEAAPGAYVKVRAD